MKYPILIICCIISTHILAQSTATPPAALPGVQATAGYGPLKKHNLLLQRAHYIAAAHSGSARTTSGPGPVFDTAQWAHRVDSTWGTGWSTSTKLSVLNSFWGHIDSLYPGFVNLPAYNWDSVITSMRSQITAGVSEGRYAAIINYLLGMMNDGHSNFYDYEVNYPNTIYQGLPLFRGESGLLGACVTTLNDTTAMVYDAFPGQPFGLQPGDIILGYNGIPWTNLVQIILGYNLPNSVYKGSTDSATWHRYIQAAGENWYMFDTINIQKCDGSLVNFPTSLMEGVLYNDFCTEQMPVPGVYKPSYTDYYYLDSSVTSGVVTGTRIGYVYMYDCEDTTGLKLYNAVKTLIEDSLVTGLILDIRTNFGGGFNAYWTTYEYLASGGTSWVGYGQRSDPTNRLAMYIDGPSAWYDIYDSDPGYFNNKIAILCGPNAVSAGDFLPVMFRHQPRVKLFGKSTAGAFGNLIPVDVGNGNFATSMQETNFFQASAPGVYLSHTYFPVDYPVWLNHDSVCAGTDNVVSTAIQWIQGVNAVKTIVQQPLSISLFPNPANSFVNLYLSSQSAGQITVQLYNMLGAVTAEHNYTAATGDNVFKFALDNKNIPSGNYYLQITNSDQEKIIKKLTIIH